MSANSRGASIVCASLAVASIVACGSANDGMPSTGGAGSSRAGAAGSSRAGETGAGVTSGGGATHAVGGSSSIAGNNPLGGQSSTTGGAFSASAGSGGAAGSTSGGIAGSAAVVVAFDPTVPTPSHDCRTDPSPNCIAVAGTYDGVAVDTYCNVDDDLSVTIQGGKWAIGCNHLMPGFARLFVPVARPGNYSEQVSVGSKPMTEFEFKGSASPFGSVLLGDENFQHAEVAWRITAASWNYRLVEGTFHGKWAVPSSACGSSSGLTCVAADVNVSFRLLSEYGYCFADTDCPAPRVCDPIAFACYD